MTKNLKNILSSRNFDQLKFSHWQVASDGIWEDAYQVSKDISSTELSSFIDWLVKQSSDIALEAFFGDKHSSSFFFFGFRVQKLSKNQQSIFFETLFSSPELASFSDVYDCLVTALLTASDGMYDLTKELAHGLDFLEVGAEGFWKSKGSVIIWEKKNENKKALSYSEFKESAPQLIEPFERAIMLEHAWAKNIPVWLALPLSIRDEKGFVFDENIYERSVSHIVEHL